MERDYMNGKKMVGALAGFALMLAGASLVRADTIVSFSGSGTGSVSNPLSAKVKFDQNGTSLTVTLTNTNASAPVAPPSTADALFAVFFDYGGPGSLSAPTSTVASSLVNLDLGTVESTNTSISTWDFKSGISYNSTSYSYGLGGAGLNVFSGSVTKQPAYGIVPAGFTQDTQDGFKSKEPQIQDHLTFTFTVASNFDVNKIGGVLFQYGTSSSDTAPPGTPDLSSPPPSAPLPPTGWAGVGMMLALGAMSLRRRCRTDC
jgi:hypothetical protein